MAIGKSRRRGTTTPNTITSNEEEEADVLLDYGEPECRGMPKRYTKYGYKHQDRSSWIRPLSLAFITIFFATIAFSSFTILFVKPSLQSLVLDAFSNSENGINEGRILGIELHPEDHVFRKPKTITHHWTITSASRSPDGVKKDIYLVNGEFPGPTIECRSGDRLEIHVTNSLESGEGISIHWHGLNMRNANNMDGAVAFTQCPIPSGKTFKYEFEIDEDQAGTFWWHAHSQVQRGDGMYGGLVVHRPPQKQTDMEEYGYQKEVLLLIGDWYHRNAEEVLAWYTSARGFGNEVRIPE
jgi:FtsP/CotA-like multicopper oxidase with cupredoxin domain